MKKMWHNIWEVFFNILENGNAYVNELCLLYVTKKLVCNLEILSIDTS